MVDQGKRLQINNTQRINSLELTVDKEETTRAEQNAKTVATDASPKLSKRAKLIEEKLKTKQSTSLFDTDGDLNKCNIIEGGRRRRNKTTSSDTSTSTSSPSNIPSPQVKPRGKPGPKPRAKPGPKPSTPPPPPPPPARSKPGPKPRAKPAARAKLVEAKPRGKPGPKPKLKNTQLMKQLEQQQQQRLKRKRPEPVRRAPAMPLYKNAKIKLMPKPTTSIDQQKNDLIARRLSQMEKLQQNHDKSVKELYHLELFQNMLDYNPKTFINDVRYNQVNRVDGIRRWNAVTDCS